MIGEPIFIEAAPLSAHPALQVCRKAIALLSKRGIQPVALAETAYDVYATLKEFEELGLSPAIFVVNTFEARDILLEAEPLFGNLPVFYLRRRLFTGRSGLLAAPRRNGSDTSQLMASLTPRPTSVWFYGSKNSDQVAVAAARVLFRFLQDGDFQHIESLEDRLMPETTAPALV
ncbi:MAG: hypothetical protein ABSE73_10090 [Planctomycetota bacterium]